MRTITNAIVEQGRATEWLTSCVLLIFALTLAMPGETFNRVGFTGFREFGITEEMLCLALGIIAGGRLTALYINGRWHRSPVLRLIGAMFGAVVFSMLAFSFAWPVLRTMGTETPVALGTGTGTYLVLASFEILAAYRSSADHQSTRAPKVYAG